MDYKEIKRKEVLFEIIDDVTNGMDIYNHNGSLWIINTKELKWVVEFTNDKTLWYNYNLFKNLFKGISLDLMENQKYVTEWFESRFLNMQKVKDSCEPFFDQDQYVEDTIQNGVKDTKGGEIINEIVVEDTIQNGVKYTKNQKLNDLSVVEDTIQNGVKDTKRTRLIKLAADQMVEDTIQNGVKHTLMNPLLLSLIVEDTIQNGVKHTDCYDGRRSKKVDDTIQNGVKDITYSIQKRKIRVENTIKNGVKQTELSKRDFFPEDIIQDGVKINGTYVGGKRQKENVEVVIDYGVKQTYEDVYHHKGRIGGMIRNGKKLN